MILQEHVPLSTLTTFKVGGMARYVASCVTLEDVREALQLAKEHALPFRVLGEGSNVLASDAGYEGVIVRMDIQGVTLERDGTNVLVRAGAGESWDALVTTVTKEGLWGMENLAGIPGTVGATPVQNIGAYGMEVKTIVHTVEVIDAHSGEVQTLTGEECQFGYRDSRFKHEANLIITAVTFTLTCEGTPRTDYADLRGALMRGEDLSTPVSIARTVRSIRADKFPDLREFGTAGSFFKNPVVSEAQFETLAGAYGEVPRFPNPDGVKIPLAFILDKVLGLRGYRAGKVWLFGKQPLVVVADPGATSSAIDTLATTIAEKVFEATGISIEREVRSLP